VVVDLYVELFFVGEKVAVKLNGIDHEVELLSIRNPAQVEAQPEATH
jgi:hypothetical protein